ncbi:hypothetical protein F5Y05DRAFT_394997 [Hypoxylon sp. FL0543]|nr:hypothetical protein F5Y05DRAFT_394997 [Hypoxylon sp. FL0543]
MHALSVLGKPMFILLASPLHCQNEKMKILNLALTPPNPIYPWVNHRELRDAHGSLLNDGCNPWPWSKLGLSRSVMAIIRLFVLWGRFQSCS